MQKFGEGEVRRDVHDPQGVPVADEVTKEGAVGRHSVDRLHEDLRVENDRADAAPADETFER
jgi:hypothetical protein